MSIYKKCFPKQIFLNKKIRKVRHLTLTVSENQIKMFFSRTDILAKIYSQLTLVLKTPPLRLR